MHGGKIIKYNENGDEEILYEEDKFPLTCALLTKDGGYLFVGILYQRNQIEFDGNVFSGSGGYNSIIIKLNSEKHIEWTKLFVGSGDRIIYYVTENEDGSLICGGQNVSDGVLLKLSSTGQDIYSHSYGEKSSEIFSVDILENENYLVSFPTVESLGNNSYRTYTKVMELEEKQVPEIVTKQGIDIGGVNNDYIYSISDTTDGGYIIGGSFSSNSITIGEQTIMNKGNYNSSDGLIVKLKKDGKAEWIQSIGGNNNDYVYSVYATSDGGVIVGGSIGSGTVTVGDYTLTSKGDYDGLIIKYSSDGDVEWATNIGGTGSDRINSVYITKDGSIIAGGYFYNSLKIGNYTLSSKGSQDALIIKYSSNGELEWAKSMGGSSAESANTITETKDGEIIVGGTFSSNGTITVGDYTLTSNRINDGFLIKYSSDGDVNWVTNIGGSDSDYINSIAATSDGGIVVGGYFYSNSIIAGDYTLTNSGSTDAMLIKYNNLGKIEWATSFGGSNGDYIYSVSTTNDDEIIIGGYFNSSSIIVGNQIITNTKTNYSDGFLAKFSNSGIVEWTKGIGGTNSDIINSVSILKDKTYVIGGYNNSSNFDLGNNTILENKGNYDGYIARVVEEMGVPEIQKLEVDNMRKTFNITTDVNEYNKIKGGTISGEDLKRYETVKYGDSSIKEIKMNPDENYEIIGITVNGKEWKYTALADGSYIMPQFENMIEDKHVVVTYSHKDNKITLNKTDKETGDRLPNVEFQLDQLEERTDPISGDIVGDLNDNGTTYYYADPDNEVTENVIGPLTNNGTYYFIEQDGKYIPTNGRPYQLANGGTSGKSGTAWSYIPIDLTELTGNYKVVVNANVSSRSGYDFGFATINQSTTAPAYSNTTGRFIYISGTQPQVTTPTDYESTVVLQGGNKYYLHFGYSKSSTSYAGDDEFVVNSVKLYHVTPVNFNFNENNGVYESSNQGKDNTVCNSYIPIDLTNHSGKYYININAEISTQAGDYGYATITKTTSTPAHSSVTNRILHITENQAAQDYSYEIEGGYLYYLHMGYYKNGTVNTTGDDTFKINDISFSLSDSGLYHTTAVTNSDGQAIIQIPFGKYRVTELKAPEGYNTLAEPIVIEFRSDEGSQHVFTIENERKAKVIVHHYIKGTETKLADDEEIYGSIDENYITSPKLDIPKYSLEINENNECVLPMNANGKFTLEDIEVSYYYVPAQATVIVNHYIDGTETAVTLNDGSEAPREVQNGDVGDHYTTEELPTDTLDGRYEISEIPDNKDGTFEDETIVDYYYKLRTFDITTDVEEYDQIDILGQTETIKGGNILGEDETPYEKVNHSGSSVKNIIATPEGGYTVESITINNEPTFFNTDNNGSVRLSKFLNVTEDKHVVVKFAKKTSNVIVHHYIEGTETRVDSKYGGEVQDVTTSGAIGNPYVTKPTDELTDRYELVSTPDNASGTFTDETIEVIYYYKYISAKVYVNHFIVGTTNPVPLKNGGVASKEMIEGFVSKEYSTNKLDTIADNYKYVSDTGNTSGQMTKDDIIVNYYYAPKAYAKINYIAINSDDSETTLESVDYEGIDEESYTAHSKDFEGYKLVEKPTVETKNLDKDNLTVFNYYYRKNSGLLEKHIDLYTDELLDNESYEKNVGDDYSIENKEFEGYVLATNKKYYEKQGTEIPEDKDPEEPYIPKNHQGIVKEEPIEVRYYYVKEAKVIVKYLDKNTKEPVHTEKTIKGYEKDSYKTEPEEIEGYDLITDEEYSPTNTEGEMSRDTITVIYYYGAKAEVEVNHIYLIDESTIDSRTIKGYAKDLYKTDYLDKETYKYYRPVTNKEYYDYAVEEDSKLLSNNGVKTVGELLAKLELSEYDPYLPSNSKGEMTKEKIIVNYYYIKQAPIVVKYIDEDTGKELETSEEELKDIGNPYSTDPKTIEKYEVNVNRLPQNAEGIISEDGIEVIYYYRKAKAKTPIETSEKIEGPQTGDTTLKVALFIILVMIVMNIIDKINTNKKGMKPSSIVK